MTVAKLLVLGGARSGKSRYAEARLADWHGRRVYLATAAAGDQEMAARIAAHRARRGAGWVTVEEPLDLPGALERASRPETAVLVDCLTLWVANLTGGGADVAASRARLVSLLPALPGPIVLVASEVGLGIVPADPATRHFRDVAGELHQAIAEVLDEVVLVAAGLPLVLKPSTRGAS